MENCTDLKSRLKRWWNNVKLKESLQHFGLLITLCAYAAMGGFIFRYFEHPAEIDRLQRLNWVVNLKKQLLIEVIVNSSQKENLEDVILSELERYEIVLHEAFSGGLFNNGKIYNVFLEDDVFNKWTILKSVFFSSTILTTIGYGNIVPMTTGGRVFCILFAFIGIPLTLTVIADWGRLFASVVSTFMRYMPPLPHSVKNVSKINRTSFYALAAVCFLFVYLAAGAALFVIWEDEWTFFDGFYFCFITMTTIGFGDLVPKKPKYMLLCTLYILVGLALTSTIIELVRRQYLKSWKQLQALSGPFAETLKKMAENAPGLDVTTFQNDLKKYLTVFVLVGIYG
ncbi:TWiK family of potassium channels protein 7-like isoform X2 [Agrilus planipennis]|uniref:TWiK family of potassium channels protein 7-like isoform X2 n=1 Tax=Agrilus planipennis TaxID=224129 RepID=A0A1W4XAT9_AGRPL|nr:TWiK family of potassium channels protein 7-like isoform X2 [Agrilus planipennis]